MSQQHCEMWLYVALYYSNGLKFNRSYHWRLSTIRVGMPSRRRPLMNRMHSTDIVVNCAKYVLQLLRSFIPPVTTEYDPGAQRWHASELLAPVVIQDFHIFDMTCLTVDVKYRFLDCTSLACSYRTQTENSHLQTESITIGVHCDAHSQASQAGILYQQFWKEKYKRMYV